MTQQPPLLRDVIDIKESISTSDFVLRLAEATTPEGVERALQNYVVTDRLRENFNEALDLIKAALDGHESKAAHLHGSFGSGKSHFMAVLYALLSGNSTVRGNRDFDLMLARHEWLQTDGNKFLLVPYHMLGAKALEQRVLGKYVEHVKRLHPDAPIPQVYRSDSLFADIRRLRDSMGVEAVIRGLGVPDGDDEDEWGESFAWTAELLEQALNAPEEHEEGVSLNLLNPSTPAELRAKLVQDASTHLLPGFAQNAAEDQHGFISLDAGLKVIAEHAKSLGYHGLILFLDELILWMTSLIHDQKFVAREADKITNFVEGADARRAIPIVSFIARQRDLRELVGEEASGAAEAAIQNTLNLVSGRFDRISLEDRNLPQIAHARLLSPIGGPNGPAAQLIDQAFEQTKALGPNVWDELLGSDKSTTGADEASFRLTYPFSPAFMDTLVHISSALQRSRTGLKLMGELLAAGRDSLRLGDLVALGDLYPVIAQGGDKPFVDDLKVVFAAADKLYRARLRPYLLNTNEVTEDDVQRYLSGPDLIEDPTVRQRCKVFVGENRLVCTLLLSALAPSVPALNDLTIRRLGALNHGSVVAPIPGSEIGIIKSKIDDWAARFPEIKPTGTAANPGVRLELSGVDVDSIIQNAKVNNNPGNRAALARRLLIEELGLDHTEGRISGGDELNFVWQGSQRTVEVVFGNIADEEELPDHDTVPQIEGRWRIVVDLPYDEGSFKPVDDFNRVRRLKEAQGEPSRTLAWIPTHLSAQRYDDFQRLVTIDKALADEQRFATQYAVGMNADKREHAKGLLESQRGALLKQVTEAFRQAYGLRPKDASHVEVEFDQHFDPLPDVPGLRPKFGQSMREAIRHVGGQLLEFQFPGHPDLDRDGTGNPVKPAEARTVFGHVQLAAEAPNDRIEVPAKDRRLMARIAEPLGLGVQKEAYFELSHQWADHFRMKARTNGVTGDLSLVKLADWIDEPEARGLDEFLVNLVVASFAEMDDRVWVREGTTLNPPPTLPEIKPRDALRTQPLPSESDWKTAGERFEAIFGTKAPTLLRGRMVNQFAREIAQGAERFRGDAEDLVRRLEEHAEFLGLDETDEAGRLAVARRSVELLKDLESTGQGGSAAKRTVETLARFDLRGVGANRYGASVKQAHKVAGALVGASWDVIALADGQGVDGAALLESLRNVARQDQMTADLSAALAKAVKDVTDLIRRNQPAKPPRPDPNPPGDPDNVDLGGQSNTPPVTGRESTGTGTGTATGGTGTRGRSSGSRRTTAAKAAAELQRELEEVPVDATIEITWQVVD